MKTYKMSASPSASPSGVDPWEPLGAALAEHVETGAAQLTVHQEDGESWSFSADVFFRGSDVFSEIEALALDVCRGSVLDVGAGAGCHALALQERGLAVTALDLAPKALDVMRARGVIDVRRGDILEFVPQPGEQRWETLLLLMNGLGVVGDLAGLDRFLVHAHELVAPDGQILFDSCDLRDDASPAELLRMVSRRKAGRYRGETRQALEHRGLRGDSFAWLYADPVTLRRHAARAGWESQVVFNNDDGTYLARLVPSL